MRIKKGDTVKIISGSGRGKAGKVLKVISESDKLTVEGVNLRSKHMRPRRQGQKGQKIEFPAPLHFSNVLLVCPKCNKGTRIGINVQADGKKLRVCKKCKQMID